MGSLGCTSKGEGDVVEREEGEFSVYCVYVCELWTLGFGSGGLSVDWCSTTKKKSGVSRARPLRHIHSLVVNGVQPIRTHPSLPPSLILAWR